MDFRNQDSRQAPATPAAPATASAPSGRRKSSKFSKGLRLASVALLFSATILVVALLIYVAFGGPKSEQDFVDKSKYQAVFLNGGQVYFGHIQDLNDKYVRLSDIYYLSVSQQVQPDQDKNKQQNQNITLVRLGCELHRPQNNMLINRDQVIFWENLKDDDSDTTVPGAVKKYLASNPNGQTCQTPNADNSNTDDKKQ